MKMTKKLIQASYTVKILNRTHQQVYSQMEELGYAWKAKAGRWIKVVPKTAQPGSLAGEYGVIIRFRGLPVNVHQAIQSFRASNAFWFGDMSEEQHDYEDGTITVYLKAYNKKS